jgi:hypothetical protein
MEMTMTNVIDLQAAADAAAKAVKTKRTRKPDATAAKRKAAQRSRKKIEAAVTAALASRSAETSHVACHANNAEVIVPTPVSESACHGKSHAVTRIAAGILATVTGGLGAWAAFEYGTALEHGQINYLSLAAPAVALTAGILPAIAERSWQAGQWVKSLVLWAAVIPCAATVFFAAAERVHLAKGAAETERASLHQVVDRAAADLTAAKAEANTARIVADKVRGLEGRACNVRCASLKASETAARARVAELEGKLTSAQGKAVSESPLRAPTWLLPASLDFASFVLTWFALSVPGRRRWKV